MFSERILVGETLETFQRTNVIISGSQGAGKSMLLNLIRLEIVAEMLAGNRDLPDPLKTIDPYFGISINLIRANFPAFGRRSVSRVLNRGDWDPDVDLASAADYINHYLFYEFLKGMDFLFSHAGMRLREWLSIVESARSLDELSQVMANWTVWFGYYSSCSTFEQLLGKSRERLLGWTGVLNANTDEVPEDIWKTKTTIGAPLHSMGNLLRDLSNTDAGPPLFVAIDQYEVLPELNQSYGTDLQRVVNTLIKARDPVVYFKLGARTHDWGKELRIWGSEARVEIQRDYVIVNLSDVLMRSETQSHWLFHDFATDVAFRRIAVERDYAEAKKQDVWNIFGKVDAERESWLYFPDKARRNTALRGIPAATAELAVELCSEEASPLELRLCAAWILQRTYRRVRRDVIISEAGARPWLRRWWHKERVVMALVQIASAANQRKLYFGWETALYLSGGNIAAFILMCREVWDAAAKRGSHPLIDSPLEPQIQTEGMFQASQKWRERDRNENIGGRFRYEVLSRLGPAIHESVIADIAMSNPGHTGFSLRESDVLMQYGGDELRDRVRAFLDSAVDWAIFEERPHTSKLREASARRKWYLHPLLSPFFQIPHIRVKEPLYVDLVDVYRWLFDRTGASFGHLAGARRGSKGSRRDRATQLGFEDGI
jgi:hypothetical protein